MKTLMGSGMLAVAGWTVWKNRDLKRRAEQSQSWPRVEGAVFRSTISLQQSGGYQQGSNKTFKAEIAYRYKVGKSQYHNNKICVGGQLQLSLRGKAEGYCQKYPVGRTVTVYYNPDDPWESCLEPREETSWFYLLIGAVFGLIGFAFVTGIGG